MCLIYVGIKLVIELVPNHTSRRHKWFIQSRQSANNPYSNFYIWDNGRRFENGTRYPPNNWVINYKHFLGVYMSFILTLLGWHAAYKSSCSNCKCRIKVIKLILRVVILFIYAEVWIITVVILLHHICIALLCHYKMMGGVCLSIRLSVCLSHAST